MNRKAKNIIFWTVCAILVFVFVICFGAGCIKTIFGAGTKVYNVASNIIVGIGLNKSDFFKWSPYICILCGLVLTFMFFKKYNTRIN